ncbi:MAG: DUF4833 domain-containing protein [Bacteroidota bacterium]
MITLFIKIKNSKLRIFYFLQTFFLASFTLLAQTKTTKIFPKPEGIKNMLFYVQRTMNTNTIIYELNLDANQELNIEEPIKIFWKCYAKKGEIEPLNYIQRNFAYGLEVKMIDHEKKSFSFNFVSYKKQTIYLLKSVLENKYYAYTTINSKLMLLTHIFIQIEGGSFWTPKVKYIEITGKDPEKNIEIVQKVIP